jgi:hypothetical protein
VYWVCGGRSFSDQRFLEGALDDVHARHGPFSVVIDGDARGANQMAGDWARARAIENRKFAADWAGLGRKAGPIRNQRMLDEGAPDLVIAFPGGRGTADIVRRAEAAGVVVLKVDWDPTK